MVQTEDYGAGKVKLELLYNRKQEKLSVMVRHVKDLVSNIIGRGPWSDSLMDKTKYV